ncbi:MAG: GDP-mannose 4,6-dehydratase [Chloroflexi bacterium]|nr:GDP-mannose 4,6-dehydratase [Chloroflexota bacterium]
MASETSNGKVVVLGGAGFIGVNAAAAFLDRGNEVVVFDNVSRRGANQNLCWLRDRGRFEFVPGDIRREDDVGALFACHPDATLVLHLAAQVAVTTSVANPRDDFLTNALGTLNVLEAVREWAPEATLLYSSTNKVYGGMEDVPVEERDGRHQYADLPCGVSEDRPLDFHSPYGCSKGAADQYVRDYARIYGMKTVSLRQSCIYGPRQFGVEDQGWVAWFAIAGVTGQPITLYGDGKQVRDVLYIDDLVRAFELAAKHIDVTAGQVYNIGGGPSNVLSLLELIAHLEALLGRKLPCSFEGWRPGDQKVYVSNIEKARRDFGWSPTVPYRQGVERLVSWVRENRVLFTE